MFSAYKNTVDFCHALNSMLLKTLFGFIILMLIGIYKGLGTNIFIYFIIALIFALLRIIFMNMETGLIKTHAWQNRLSQETKSLPGRQCHFYHRCSGQRGCLQTVILEPNHTQRSKSIVIRKYLQSNWKLCDLNIQRYIFSRKFQAIQEKFLLRNREHNTNHY